MVLRAIGVCLLAAVLSPSAGAATSEPAHRAETARVVVATVVRPEPGRGNVVQELATRTRWGGFPQRLLVLESARAADGREWIRVRLPGRPNASAGWVPRDAVSLRRNPWFLDVSLSRRLVRVYRDGAVVRVMRAVVGAADTPTPVGLFAVYEAVPQQAGGDGFLGPWALHLTAFSNVLDDYGGGPGRIAIHGRGGASLADPLGTARSHGCIRVGNRDVTWLARHVPAGSPVRIRS